ncbi:DDB1CUL4-associated and CUL4-associated factor 17 isoform X2 [Octopus vulgaris]|uniref:DDB1CUL4-associated and CUL4-associated factor 17 isoform X2 n=2 Tax=Octopus TaxID=6643 RepID=A0AA36BDJ1_OCTVU|nr:DDB1- and CUL4-associated factor 17 isoform X2 [Octopus sinensis]CAI9731682.1 DDB1CUL4-associated and CUL4-associated factor 17 isoform X2 [Octopus vulgaris]
MLALETKVDNIYCLIRYREYKISNGTLRKAMRSLCYKSGHKYKCTFEVHSKQPIFSTGWGIKIWQDCHHYKLSDILYCCGSLEINPNTNMCYKPSIIGISDKNTLVRVCAETGRMFNKVFLSGKLHFRTIEWDDPQYSIAISSTTITTFSQPDQNRTLCKAIALFSVAPLKFIGMFTLDSKIFGPKFEDGLVTDNLLIINYRGGFVELYSMDFILKHYVLYEAQLCEPDPVTGHVVGLYPHGLPFNIKIKAQPPLMLRVKSVDHDIQFGGFPFHMLLASEHRGVFYVKSLVDNNLIQGGLLDLGNEKSIEDDTAVFHPDVHNKIILYGGSTIRILKLVNDVNSQKCIRLQKEILLDQIYKSPMLNNVTRSGRHVRSAFNSRATCYQSTVNDVIYDSELDTFAILTQDQNDCFSCNLNTRIRIYDNETCDQLGEIKIDLPTDEVIDSNFFLNCGTLIRISKSTANKFVCTVYKPIQ